MYIKLNYFDKPKSVWMRWNGSLLT